MKNVESPKVPSNYSFNLRFPISDIEEYSKKYIEGLKPKELKQETELLELSPIVANRGGYLTISELEKVGNWKSVRSKPKIKANHPDFVKEVTLVAFSTPSEKLRIEVLTLLQGVAWPTASVLLHLFHREKYPIIDYRALSSLDCVVKYQDYNFEFWLAYTAYTNDLAKKANVTMRTLDRALWKYSKLNDQKSSDFL